MGVSDPVGAAWVAGLSRPAGNITGLLNLDASMGGQWLELLLAIAPSIRRAAAMFHPDAAPGTASYYMPSFEAAARSFEVEPVTAPVHSDAEIETAITSLGREPQGGLVVMPDDGFMLGRRAQAILPAARNNVPAVYNDSVYVREGGLLSYGINRADITRREGWWSERSAHPFTLRWTTQCAPAASNFEHKDSAASRLLSSTRMRVQMGSDPGVIAVFKTTGLYIPSSNLCLFCSSRKRDTATASELSPMS
jgi:hypothetical protein